MRPMGAAVAEMKGSGHPSPMLKKLEEALQEAERDVRLGEQQQQEKLQLRDDLVASVMAVRRRLNLPVQPDQMIPHEGSLTQGIRDLLHEYAKESDLMDRTLTVKDIEHAVWAKGYRSGASRFYWAVNGTLRSMADVVMVIKEGETSRFGLRDSLPRAPGGWRLVENPRRTTSASRRGQSDTSGKPPTPDKSKGRGR